MSPDLQELDEVQLRQVEDLTITKEDVASVPWILKQKRRAALAVARENRDEMRRDFLSKSVFELQPTVLFLFSQVHGIRLCSKIYQLRIVPMPFFGILRGLVRIFTFGVKPCACPIILEMEGMWMPEKDFFLGGLKKLMCWIEGDLCSGRISSI